MKTFNLKVLQVAEHVAANKDVDSTHANPDRSNDRHDHRDVSTPTITQIMVEVLTVLAIALKELRQGSGVHGRQSAIR